jgi:two-component sensor histidine kinase
VARRFLSTIAAGVRLVGKQHTVRLQVPAAVLVLEPDDAIALAGLLTELAHNAASADARRRTS